MIQRALELLRRPKPAVTPELERRIRRGFDEAAADEEHFPRVIDPRIYHVQLLLRWIAPLRPERILDAGCGKGRFARVFEDHHPGARIAACDISIAMLTYVKPPLEPCAASLTALPYRDGVFDAAYATESLEHAVDIERAVAELCRVTRPGGRIAIIDKNAAHWGRLQTSEWERWFKPKELEKLLRRHCRTVEWRFVSYWEDIEPDGLFIAWLAER